MTIEPAGKLSHKASVPSHGLARAMKPMAEAGVVGYKVFLGETISNIPAPDDGVMFEGLQQIAGANGGTS